MRSGTGGWQGCSSGHLGEAREERVAACKVTATAAHSRRPPNASLSSWTAARPPGSAVASRRCLTSHGLSQSPSSPSAARETPLTGNWLGR